VLSRSALARAAKIASDWVDLQESHLARALRDLAPLARGRLLDVGCGTKPYVPIFRPYVTEYIGLEREGTFTDTHASTRGKPDVLYDGSRIPFVDASFDTVLSIQVLEHTPRPDLLMAEMARVLKTDGTLLLSAPFSFRLHEEPNDFFRYTPHGFGALCDQVGLQLTTIVPQGNLWSLIGHKINSYLALRVARAGGLAQSLGKLNHERSNEMAPRWWTLPFVAPAMGTVALSARILDEVFPDETESLGFAVVARKRLDAR
jgi:SAM-dependent methyltransferase